MTNEDVLSPTQRRQSRTCIELKRRPSLTAKEATSGEVLGENSRFTGIVETVCVSVKCTNPHRVSYSAAPTQDGGKSIRYACCFIRPKFASTRKKKEKLHLGKAKRTSAQRRHLTYPPPSSQQAPKE
ncbi:hypothetical protein AGOR_G00122400 [Albula goreensis]|uniref:Uncharacterized protein n=1 Tax=Albula goreensis TaxID=1534307 RepID=A0A8T3D980_9TELE|nr:hypothetical protein AGOR_G00122400 [Albula goreensis]